MRYIKKFNESNLRKTYVDLKFGGKRDLTEDELTLNQLIDGFFEDVSDDFEIVHGEIAQGKVPKIYWYTRGTNPMVIRISILPGLDKNDDNCIVLVREFEQIRHKVSTELNTLLKSHRYRLSIEIDEKSFLSVNIFPIRSWEMQNESISYDDFIDRYVPRYKVVNGEISVNGNVDLHGQGLDNIPVKFGRVTGHVDARNNNLESFEFLPEECDGYMIENNPGVKGLLKDIMFRMRTDASRESHIYLSDFFRPLLNKFIRKCLEYDVWFDGGMNEHAMLEAWTTTKLTAYKENKNAFLFGNVCLITLEDQEILEDFFKLTDEDWITELVDVLVEKIKTDEGESQKSIDDTRRFYFRLFCSLIQNDDRIKEILSEKYDIEEIYHKAKDVEGMSTKQMDSLAKLVKYKLTRNEDNFSRDQTHDLYVFIASDGFVEKEDGSYKKTLVIENFLKMNLYDPNDLQSINMMKMRAVHNHKSHVYMIWMPKGCFPTEQDSYMQEEIPEWMLDLINKNKTRI